MASTNGKPSNAQSARGLQIQEDMRLQRRTWTVERVGWVIMVALVIAALLGLFSIGPLSKVTAQDPAGLIQVEYDRFQRYMAPATLRVTFTRPPGAGDTVALRFSRSLIDAIGIQQIQPQPEQAGSTGDALVFTFRLAAPDRSGTAFFSVKPQSIGSVRGEIGVVGHEPLVLTPFIYP